MGKQKVVKIHVSSTHFPEDRSNFGMGTTDFGETVYINSTRRGHVVITDNGRKIIAASNAVTHEGILPGVIMGEIIGRSKSTPQNRRNPYTHIWVPLEEWESVRVDANPVR